MALFTDEVKKQMSTILDQLETRVDIVFFTQEFECTTCADTHLFLNELSALSKKIALTVYDFVKDKEKADTWKVDKIPAILLLGMDGKDTGIRFYGLPGGYEINSFLTALLEVSGKKEALPAELTARITGIKKDVHIQVFVTLSCPLCPSAVMAAHRLALENPHVRADMVESGTFMPLANRYTVTSVPKIIINELIELIGAQPLPALLDAIEKLV
jgi:glutaredoxin-like protein